MALILIRGENNSKLLNAIADLERHASLNVITKPRILDPQVADKLVSEILNSKIRTKSKVAIVFSVKEDTTNSIVKIRSIHPPAHIVVVSDEYEGYKKFKESIADLPFFEGYYSHKTKNTGLKDYKGKNRKVIQNNRLNSYSR